MKSLLATLFCCLFTTLGVAQNTELRFDAKGNFKIVQFTDVHYQPANPASAVAIQRINEVLDAEKPQLVIFTGDVVYAKPAEEAMRKVLQCVADRHIPFVVTFGNHDDEQDLTRTQLYDIIRTIPGNVLPERGDSPSPDYVLSVQSSDAKNQAAAILYCIDSHSYSTLPDVRGYAWITADQVQWYRHMSKQFADRNGGTPVPALAFFHIPLPEYNQAASNENATMTGIRMETACAPALNTGLFAAMKECGDVMGVFVGHDHDNDYASTWQGILLAYGRFTGGNTEYNHLPNGARVIVLHENTRTFDTWVRIKNNRVESVATYPDSFVKDDWKKRPLSID